MVVKGKGMPLPTTTKIDTAEVKRPLIKRDPILDMYDSEGILGAKPGMAKDGEKQVSVGMAALIMKREALGKEWEKLCEKPADPVYRMTMSRRMDALGDETLKKGEKRRVALIDRGALGIGLVCVGIIGGMAATFFTLQNCSLLAFAAVAFSSAYITVCGIIANREVERQMEKAVEDSKVISDLLNQLANGNVINSALLSDIKSDADFRRGLHELSLAGYAKAWELEKSLYGRTEPNPLECDFARKAGPGFASEAKQDFTGKA